MTEDIITVPGRDKFSEKKVKINNIEINWGEAGRGKPVVMVHGWTNNWTGFIPMAMELKKKYKVLMVDLPGYGDSGRLKKYTLEIQAEYLKNWLIKLKVGKVVMVGHSMGTFVAAKFCQSYPEMVEKLVLIGAVFKSGKRGRMMKLSKRLFEIIAKKELSQKLVKKIVDRDIYSYLTSKYINMYKFDKKIIRHYGTLGKLKVSKEAYVQMGVEIGRTQTEDLIKNIKLPILFLYGKYDKICDLKRARAVLENKGNYCFAEIDEAGHIVTVERPEETARIIADFAG